MSHDVLAISRLFSSRTYKATRFFIHSECSSVEIVECSKKTLFCGDCCDRNQAIILMILEFVNIFVLFVIEKCVGKSILEQANLFLAI